MFNQVMVWKHQNGDEHLKGFARVVVANAVVLTGIRIIEGKNGLFVAMPQREREAEGKITYKDVFYPVNSAVKEELERIVLDEYKKIIGQ